MKTAQVIIWVLLLGILLTIIGCSKEEDIISTPISTNLNTGGSESDVQSDLDNNVPIATILLTNPVDSFYGKNYQGGLIFYVDSINVTGLISAENDLTIPLSGVQWYTGTYIITGASGVIIGTGKLNTDSIISVQGMGSSGNYAAMRCDTTTIGGYTNWYLPSKEELNAMYNNLHLNGYGGFIPSLYYWSSTENGSDWAWDQNFGTGVMDFRPKQNGFYVRPIRDF